VWIPSGSDEPWGGHSIDRSERVTFLTKVARFPFSGMCASLASAVNMAAQNRATARVSRPESGTRVGWPESMAIVLAISHMPAAPIAPTNQ
jgi:hypothetical protein